MMEKDIDMRQIIPRSENDTVKSIYEEKVMPKIVNMKKDEWSFYVDITNLIDWDDKSNLYKLIEMSHHYVHIRAYENKDSYLMEVFRNGNPNQYKKF